MTFVGVLPSAWPEWTDRCISTMAPALEARTLVIDNASGNNIGVAASWNRGIDFMRAENAEWLVIQSSAMRYGSLGGLDFLDALDKTDALVLEAHHGVGWHLIGMSREVLDEVGPFETRYHSYMEDVDWGYRFIRTYGQYGEPLWQKISCDVAFAGFAHAIDLAGMRPDNARNEAIYAEKFGGPKGQETFDHPYNDPSLDWTFVGERP